MLNLRWLLLTACVAVVLATGGIASGECVDDGNNSAADATPIGYGATVSDCVCPDDPFDYYVLEIPEGADVSGNITFASPQVSTVLRVEHVDSGTRLIDDRFTNDTVHEFMVYIPGGSIPTGTYIARVFFWSAAAYDHEYTLTLNLTVTGLCEPDGNDTTARADEIAFDTSVTGWVCPGDLVDYWHLTVVNPNTHGRGSVDITAAPGEVLFRLLDSSGAARFEWETVDGEVGYLLGTGVDPLDAGEYYIEISPAEGNEAENFYTIDLEAYHEILGPREGFGGLRAPGVSKEMLMPRLPFRPPAPWPMPRGGPDNSGWSGANGPPGNVLAPQIIGFIMEDGFSGPTSPYFRGLMVGPGNRAYFYDTMPRVLHAYDLEDGLQWSYPTTSEAYLDAYGDAYMINESNEFLLRLNINGEIVWSQRLPGDAGRTLEMVGRRAYTTSRTGEDMHTLYAWDTIGSFAWMYESIQYPIVGLVEDVSNECIYVQTWTVLYKFSWDGDRVWSRFLPYHERWSETRAPFLGPILGRDGTVWVMDYHDHRYYYVYDQDGARIKGDLRGHGSHPYAACVGRNGRFYVASADNNVTCYENWDEPVWRRRIFDEGEIGDMIMGGDDKIYVCNSYRYTGESYRLEYKWLSLDPDTGGTIHEQIISGATGIALCAGHGLAVGEGGRLIGLHSAGFLTVNSPAPELRSPGYTYTPGGG